MILVTGATGQIGGEVVRLLVAEGHAVRAITRDATRAKHVPDVEWLQADFTKPETLAPALASVEKAFFVANAGPALGDLMARFVEVAKAAGVRHVVAVSSGTIAIDPPVKIGQWHLALEERLKASGLRWTMLRPGGFSSNALRWASMIREKGTVFAPHAGSHTAPIDPRDIAAVAFAALTAPGHEGQTYHLTGSEALTAREQAERIGAALGKPVRFVEVPEESARAQMTRAGMPELMADAVLELVRAGARSTTPFQTSTVREITGREARTFDDWLRDHLTAFA